MTSPSDNKTISIVVPAYNEEQVLMKFYQAVTSILLTLPYEYEIIFINDGSKDTTNEIIHSLVENDKRIHGISLSRNFGKEIALTAGLDHVTGDAVIVMDADLQDPPELIPLLIDEWQKGFNVVNAKRSKRDGESWLKKISAFLFYRLMSRVADVDIPQDTGDFRLMDRKAAIDLAKLREHNRYMKGLFAWVGGKQSTIEFQRNSRASGESKWNYWNLWNLAIEGITSFSTLPLKFASYLGFFIAGISFLYGSYIILRTLFFGNPVPGYPSLMVLILFIGGIQLFSIGIIGEYLARIFNGTKQRPLYLIDEMYSDNLDQKKQTILDELKNNQTL